MRFCVWHFLFLILVLSVDVDCKTSSVLILYDSSNYQEQDESIIHRSKRATQNNAKITSMHVKCDVALHYVNTLITTKVINPHASSNEAEFSFILPETAYISGFTMEIDDKEYVARIEEKEFAKRIYNTAVAKGQAAAHLETRDSNHFIVSVNLEPTKKATFKLRYEELLMKKYGLYNLIINLNPGQLLDDLTVDVNITEMNPIITLNVPEFKVENEIQDIDLRSFNAFATIAYYNNKRGAEIYFSPSESQQLQMMKEFQTQISSNENDGISGQFIVQYDVQSENEGQIFINNNYFVHILAPNNLQPISKYVVFVLDISASMSGSKIRQLKEAMLHIIDTLKPTDLFSIVKFGHRSEVIIFDRRNRNNPTAVNPATIAQAKSVIRSLKADGRATYMEIGLKSGFNLIHAFKKSRSISNKNCPIMVFLTDGKINRGARGDKLITIVGRRNTYKVPIYTLGFGIGSDREFLSKLALKNDGFMTKIYDGDDGSNQLKYFFRQISSPLLVDVDYSYPKYKIDKNCITNTKFSRYYDGADLVVAGKTKTGQKIDSQFCFKGRTQSNLKQFTSKIMQVENEYELPLERLWAYLTIKQLINDLTKGVSNAASTRQRALDLALKYSFVTPITSLVVVKPQRSTVVNPVPIKADKAKGLTLSSRFGPNDEDDEILEEDLIIEPASNETSTDDDMFDSNKDVTDILSETTTVTVSITTVSNRSLYDLDNYLWIDQYIINTENIIKMPLLEDGQNITLKLKPKLEPFGLIFPSECSNAIGGGAGTCVYLTNCEKLSEGFTDLATYKNFFCNDHMYAGICCKNL